MPNYKVMYYKLFNKISDMIISLQEIQKQTEEMYQAQEKTNKIIYNFPIGDDTDEYL